jgi:hypothetical protein
MCMGHLIPTRRGGRARVQRRARARQSANVGITHLPARPDEPAVFTSVRNAARAEADALAKRVPTVTLVISRAAGDDTASTPQSTGRSSGWRPLVCRVR